MLQEINPRPAMVTKQSSCRHPEKRCSLKFLLCKSNFLIFNKWKNKHNANVIAYVKAAINSYSLVSFFFF